MERTVRLMCSPKAVKVAEDVVATLEQVGTQRPLPVMQSLTFSGTELRARALDRRAR